MHRVRKTGFLHQSLYVGDLVRYGCCGGAYLGGELVASAGVRREGEEGGDVRVLGKSLQRSFRGFCRRGRGWWRCSSCRSGRRRMGQVRLLGGMSLAVGKGIAMGMGGSFDCIALMSGRCDFMSSSLISFRRRRLAKSL
jgi:hypothetical protein